jgi:sulfatase modifying factor 1
MVRIFIPILVLALLSLVPFGKTTNPHNHSEFHEGFARTDNSIDIHHADSISRYVVQAIVSIPGLGFRTHSWRNQLETFLTGEDAAKEKDMVKSSDQPKPDVITNSIGMKLVRIPAGEFMMGAEEDQDATKDAFPYADPALLPREWPRHKVRITKPFYMGQYEVTLSQFMKFRREAHYKIDAERDGKPMTGYGKNGESIESTAFRPWAPGWKLEADHPVGYVSWNDAAAFCDWLSRKEGKKYRLPTEAEWEYSCRAGTSSRYYCGNDPEQLIGFANAADADRAVLFPGKTVEVFDKSGKKTGKRIPSPFLSGHDGYAWTAPVGRFRPNSFGLYDIHGNSWEWCSDWFGEEYYRESPLEDPKGPRTGTSRVSRGGGFDNSPFTLRCARRDGGTPESRDCHDGFRVVREL